MRDKVLFVYQLVQRLQTIKNQHASIRIETETSRACLVVEEPRELDTIELEKS